MFLSIVAFIVILTLLVFVHELGHYFTARKLGIAVEEFGFGLPPRMLGVKKGKTVFSLNWIPLGGFVKIKGEQGESADDPDSFTARPVWQRAVVLSAGVTMNIVLAAVLLSFGFMIGLPQVLNGEEPAYAVVEDRSLVIASVLPDSSADKNNLKSGDKIIEIDGRVVTAIDSAQNYFDGETNNRIPLTIERAKENIIVEVIPYYNEEVGRGVIGVELMETGVVSYTWWKAIWTGIVTTGLLLREIIFAFGHIIVSLFMLERVSVDVSGPIGIAILTSQVTSMGIIYLIQFAAILSLNLAIINFLPFPALDGGRVLFLIIEKIRGVKVNQTIENLLHNAGFALLMLLVILVTYKDITKHQGNFVRLWDKITSLF